MKINNEIRIIAPSSSIGRKSPAHYARAQTALKGLGYSVTYSAHCRDVLRFGTAMPESRAEDFMQAYRDTSVVAVMAAHGGWSANAILPYIDWEVVRSNPKPLIGFSDITVLINAVYAHTGQVGYLGPNFSSLGGSVLPPYVLSSLKACLERAAPVRLVKSDQWQRSKGHMVSTPRWKIMQPGSAEARLIGGNIGTFYLLQGTPHQPKLDEPFILVAEDDAESGKFTAREFDRRLQSILQLPGAKENIQGLLIGRFEPESGVNLTDVAYIVEKLNVPNIPIIANMDFGHTWPLITLPIGGTAKISTDTPSSIINLIEW